MTGRALTPATRHRLGRPLPHQLADRPRAHPTARASMRGPLSRSASKPAPHAVLAQVSLGYPPLSGRSLTCYSPVRRFTHSRRSFLARLACVRHAASVRPEPGSNSPCFEKSLEDIRDAPKDDRSLSRLIGTHGVQPSGWFAFGISLCFLVYRTGSGTRASRPTRHSRLLVKKHPPGRGPATSRAGS